MVLFRDANFIFPLKAQSLRQEEFIQKFILNKSSSVSMISSVESDWLWDSIMIVSITCTLLIVKVSSLALAVIFHFQWLQDALMVGELCRIVATAKAHCLFVAQLVGEFGAMWMGLSGY